MGEDWFDRGGEGNPNTGVRLMADDRELLVSIDGLLDGMIAQQRRKASTIARRLNPRLTDDDLMNPFDWPEVGRNPQFCFEDGLTAGLEAARMAIQRLARGRETPGQDAGGGD